MLDREHESARALTLAYRAYSYSLLHVAFGSEPTHDTVAKIFSAQTLDAFRSARALLAEDSFQTLGGCTVVEGLSVSACIDEAIACVEKAVGSADDPSFAESLRSDYAKLFQVPGDSYVHPWESPYVGKESMLFQESTLDVRAFYHDAGFQLQGEKHFPDDHIAAMMDFLGRLSQRVYEAYADGCDDEAARTLEVQRAFSECHVLSWVDKFAQKVAEKDARGYYATLAGYLAAFARLDAAFAGLAVRELAR